MNWISLSQQLPPEGVLVDTKIDDIKGIRNETGLIRRGNLFWTGASDRDIYVYYTPTHWKYREEAIAP